MLSRLFQQQSIRITTACILVFLTAVVLRTAFVAEMIDQFQQLPPDTQTSFRYGFLTPDSRSYLESAGRIAKGDLLNAGSLSRPPGYPLFLWACGRVSSRVLTAQAVIGALIPVGTLLLSFLVIRNVLMSSAAGMLSAVSPTGIGVTGLVLADLLLAALFALGLLLLLAGSSRDHLLSIAVWWLFRKAERRPVTWFQATSLLALPIGIFLGWASCNYARDGVFSVSEIGPRTVRVYWAAAVDAWGTSQREPSGQEIRHHQTDIRQRLQHLPPKQRMRLYREESLEIFTSYPAIAVVVLLTNMKAPAVQGWDHFHVQVPLTPSLLNRLQRASRAESSVHTFMWWPVMLAFLASVLAIHFRPSPEICRIGLLTCGLSVAYFYFSLMSGVTFWTGPRIVYPVESVALSILVAILVLVFRVVRNMSAQRPSGYAATAPSPTRTEDT
jgi:hypothetical protein